jgi:myo-inositol-1(or 4)-monophosphatase
MTRTRTPDDSTERRILDAAVVAATAAGRVLLDRFSSAARIADGAGLIQAIRANDAASEAVLRPALEAAAPHALWDDDEEGRGSLGADDWWVTDPAEGNVNHIHGLPSWGVTATLVRDDVPQLAVVHLPLSGDTYTAVRGRGAFRNGQRIRVSDKTDLGAALVATGQAKPGESAETTRLMGLSITTMLTEALLVSAAVPAALQVVLVAAGHTDAFWQYGQVRSGLVAGALLVSEAGGSVTDTAGLPWALTSDDFLATTPGLLSATTNALSGLH